MGSNLKRKSRIIIEKNGVNMKILYENIPHYKNIYIYMDIFPVYVYIPCGVDKRA